MFLPNAMCLGSVIRQATEERIAEQEQRLADFEQQIKRITAENTHERATLKTLEEVRQCLTSEPLFLPVAGSPAHNESRAPSMAC